MQSNKQDGYGNYDKNICCVRGGSQIMFAGLGGWVGRRSKIWKRCKLYSMKSQTIRQVGDQKSVKIVKVICE